jgi:16S rRNA (cytosine967-C5)-methyltransferase
LNAWCLPKLKDASRGLPAETQIALSIGLAQLAWLPGVATHAAVDESVSLVLQEKIGFPPHSGMVNAILRSASGNRDALASELDSTPDEADRSPFAELLLKAALQDDLSFENVRVFWSRLQRPPSPAFVVLSGEPPGGLVPDAQFPDARRLIPGTPFPTGWLRSGAGMVQDISSQALMNFNWSFEKSAPMRILDVCAAPGGKTTTLAKMWPQAKIFALEQTPRRAQKLRENLAARSVRAQIEVAESVAWMRSGGRPFDLILVDAPCSASGTIRKHPELVWIYKYQDVERLVRMQKNLLDAALSRLSPGGLLIYSACSWFPEEGLNHPSRLESLNPKIKPAPIWPDAGGAALTHIFRPDPLTWDGEGFQGFAVTTASV